MQRRVVEVVGIGEDVLDVFPCDPLDPVVAENVLRIVNSEETQMKVASVKNDRRENT